MRAFAGIDRLLALPLPAQGLSAASPQFGPALAGQIVIRQQFLAQASVRAFGLLPLSLLFLPVTVGLHLVADLIRQMWSLVGACQ